eukprot:Hpha_TRINITY_DN26341_c0_g1::TRINITY_DN26341_c0_g1_i1::g.9292::m.9292
MEFDEPPRDLYAVLGVAISVSAGELRNAYRRRALETHPDKSGQGAEGDFLAVREAYTTLLDPVSRLAYDERYAAYYRRRAGPDVRGLPPLRSDLDAGNRGDSRIPDTLSEVLSRMRGPTRDAADLWDRCFEERGGRIVRRPGKVGSAGGSGVRSGISSSPGCRFGLRPSSGAVRKSVWPGCDLPDRRRPSSAAEDFAEEGGEDNEEEQGTAAHGEPGRESGVWPGVRRPASAAAPQPRREHLGRTQPAGSASASDSPLNGARSGAEGDDLASAPRRRPPSAPPPSSQRTATDGVGDRAGGSALRRPPSAPPPSRASEGSGPTTSGGERGGMRRPPSAPPPSSRSGAEGGAAPEGDRVGANRLRRPPSAPPPSSRLGATVDT